MFAKMIDNIGAIEEKLNIKLYFHYISYGNEKIFYENKFKNNSNVKIHNLYPKENMSNFYSEIDLLLLLSTRLAESLGLVSLEAMSCDIPVVGTDAFAVKEYISSGKTGERFKMRNYDDMLLAIKKVIENYNNYKPREYIINKYSNKSVSYGYKEYFNDK
jgi:glycosyltransferase involved in cell wall biosynthesis